MINKYITKFNSDVNKFEKIIDEKIINTKVLDTDKLFIDGELFFTDKSVLNFLEMIYVDKMIKEKYKYHYMNDKKELIFRYDNAKHHKELKTFPHHKHTQDGVSEAQEPNIEVILNEIENKI